MTAGFGCVVLTRGERPDGLRRAIESLERQREVDVDVVVVGNGWEPTGLPAGVRALALPENVGATAGRNAGVPRVRGEHLLFLDDDAYIADDDALARIARIFSLEPSVGLVQPRVEDPTGAPAPRHWVPRLRVGDRTRSSDVTAVWEGAVAVRRSVFERAGGWPNKFFYFHEGVDLAWRALDAGFRIRYAGDVLALHPALPAARHPGYYRLSARNRVWLARRHLPLPLAVAYVAVWLVRTAARIRSRADGRELARGYLEGLRQPCGARRRLGWRTVWRMTLAGRPPVV